MCVCLCVRIKTTFTCKQFGYYGFVLNVGSAKIMQALVEHVIICNAFFLCVYL